MAALPLPVNALHKSQMEHHGKFGNTIGRIQHIDLMSRIGIYYTACRLSNQIVAPNIPGFQVIKHCIQYLASNPHKPIFYTSNYHYGSNVIRLIWSGNQDEDYTTQNVLEFPQNVNPARILNRRRSVSGISHTLLGVAV